MDKKVKYAIIGGGALIIVAVMVAGKAGKSGHGAKDEYRYGLAQSLINQTGETNREAFRYMSGLAKINAEIVINRDTVNGATALRTIESLDNLVAMNAQVTIQNAQTFAGVQSARIFADAQYKIAAQQASAAKYIAKQERKAAKYASNSSMFGSAFSFLGTAAKAAPAIIAAV